MRRAFPIVLVLLVAVFLSGCPEEAEEATTTTAAEVTTTAAVTETTEEVDDQQMADELWQKIADKQYEAWATVPGKGTQYTGQPPHGAFISLYLSPEAEQALTAKPGEFPGEAILVKENYTEDKTLDALTVMYKEPGYDDEHNDWFWAKFSPDGQVQAAGKVGDCISCHGAAESNDYVFTFPIATIQAPAGEPSADDQQIADELWQKIADKKYEGWATVPGKGKQYAGQPPHGAFISLYLSPEADDTLTEAPGEFAEESILVKENYTEDKTLDALTVMYKEPGYDDEHNDWFWAKFSPDGQVQAAGKVGDCISCHGAVQSNDYVFSFPATAR